MASLFTMMKALAALLIVLAASGAEAAPPTCRLLATPASVPAGAPVNLLAACTPDLSTFTWSNTGFGSNQSSGTVHPSVTTTYSVIGWNAEGSSNPASVTVTVTGPPLVPPTCTVTAAPARIKLGEASILTTNCNPTATSYSWSNGILNPTASVGTVYPKTTTTYTLRASNAAGIGPQATVTVTVDVPVQSAPSCLLTASSDYVLPGGASRLTATCNPVATSYVWTHTGFSTTASSGTIYPAATKTYSVVGFNELGGGNTASVTVTVSATPGSCTGGMVWNGSACACLAGLNFVDGQCFAPIPASRCGLERWDIKTGTDAAAAAVNTRAFVPSTLSILGAVGNAAIPGASRLSPIENTVYVVDATLTRYSMTDDSDYHLVLSDSGKTLVAKLPHPDCVGAGSPFASAISGARAAFNAQLRTTRAFKTTSIPVRITGIGYSESNRNQTGAAPNGVELHPILKIDFNPTTPQGGDPDFPLASDADRLLNWAEVVYADLFPKPGAAGVYLQYSYRYYARTGNYLATDPNGRVVLHNGREWNLLDVGSVPSLMPAAVNAGF